MKFKYLKIDLTSQTTYNCHAASPHRIDFQWLSNNSGNLFNTETNVEERRMMLRNERNLSCEQNCWIAEDVGAVSPRIFQHGQEKTHVNAVTSPEIIDLTLNSECNLTCAYCCKEFSNSWRRDLIDNGEYQISNFNSDRYRMTKVDNILNLVSQKEMHDSPRYRALIKEIQSYAPSLKRLDITGGEPFLDNQLVPMLESLNLHADCKIWLYTGLGVEQKRFAKIIESVSKIPNVCVRVSAETIGKLLEFNRYGIDWNEFQQKINILKNSINYEFHCTLTNLTALGFVEFYNQYPDVKKIITFAYNPEFMSPYVLDDETKQSLIHALNTLPESVNHSILQSIKQHPTVHQRQALKEFLLQFVSRRKNLSFDIFPQTLLSWLGLDHVV
jgi:organic radical activating enzyme